MDWDANGKTTPSELLAAIDVHTRRVQLGTASCIDYYSLKDGLTVGADWCTGR